jgi:hypothetical protein
MAAIGFVFVNFPCRTLHRGKLTAVAAGRISSVQRISCLVFSIAGESQDREGRKRALAKFAGGFGEVGLLCL